MRYNEFIAYSYFYNNFNKTSYTQALERTATMHFSSFNEIITLPDNHKLKGFGPQNTSVFDALYKKLPEAGLMFNNLIQEKEKKLYDFSLVGGHSMIAGVDVFLSQVISQSKLQNQHGSVLKTIPGPLQALSHDIILEHISPYAMLNRPKKMAPHLAQWFGADYLSQLSDFSGKFF